MRHFNMAAYILRSMSRFEGADPLPLVGCAGVGVSGFFAVVLSRLEAFDRFLLLVTIHQSRRMRHCSAGEIFLVDVQDAGPALHIHKENFYCATMTHPPGLVNGD